MFGYTRLYPALTLATLTLLQACGGGGGSGDSAPAEPEVGVGGSFLHVSVPDFYFGTRDVGTSASQAITITNRGGDIYPIKTVKVTGDHADEFTTDFYDEIILKPAEQISLTIDFEPVVDGRKYAALDIDFETIKQATDEQNAHEQNFYKAADLEKSGDYAASRVAYQEYIDGGPITKNKHQAAIKEPILKEASVYGDGDDFDLYLGAINARETGELDRALADLDAMDILHSDSYLADDAAYLRAYIQLIDQEDYTAAEASMKQLRIDFPESSYYDTALYSEGLAHKEMGNRQLARNIFEDLKYRHTGVEVLGVQLAKDNLLSRMWFDRAEKEIALLDS